MVGSENMMHLNNTKPIFALLYKYKKLYLQNQIIMIRKTFIILFCVSFFLPASAQRKFSIENNFIKITWVKSNSGWELKTTTLMLEKKRISDESGSTHQTVIYSENKPDMLPVESFKTNQETGFPEKVFKYPTQAWESNISEVSLNTAGIKEITANATLIAKNPLTFETRTESGIITSVWSLNENYIIIKQTFKALKTGYFGVTTPSLFTSKPDEVRKAVIPGYLMADSLSNDFVAAYGYGHYIPNRPVIYRDRCATTPMAILSKGGFTVAVAPEEKYPRKSHDATKNTHFNWNVGLSMMNPQAEISPTLYYPVLGQENSYMKAGDEVVFEYRYILSGSNWYDVFKQSVYDVFGFEKQKNIIENKQSLIYRVFQMYNYLTNRTTSRFRIVEDEEGMSIGAQDYLGGVVGSDKDAMKNSDYGAMWMLASLTQDTLLTKNVLPYARNFKLKQLYTDNSQFNGAVKGQYFLWKSKHWAEEWGQHVEPIGVMYYALADMGNILLFNPEDEAIRSNFRFAAEYLLKNQRTDGSWVVGYDKADSHIIYPDLQDLRPTFYGMLIAYDILKEKKYLDAAIRGAEWFIRSAVNTGKFIGVCGDTRFAPDFATSQSVQALLEMFKVTGNEKYKEAAITTAQIYTTYIYTYPNGITETQTHKKQTLPGWAFTQSGLCFEHAGTIGSSNTRGPILLASHAGMFVRMFQLTHDSLFIDMARVAANGKDAFVDKSTGVASYYWDSFDAGAGSFPHHAWWQIGWIMDYLMSEAELRSDGRISFPRGFITPKVGPHQTIGFADGTIDGKKAKLVLVPGLVQTDNPQCDYLTIRSDSTFYVLAMNSSAHKIKATITVKTDSGTSEFKNIDLEAYGLKIIEL